MANPTKLMLGLHPWNTSRWSGISWCDTLVDFAEANDLLLICPDGGVDGKVDDPIDIAFTTAILDSMLVWYNIDTAKTYVMGFSWGGLTTYTYGLSNPQTFGGYLPIGAAINGTSPIASFSANAKRKPVYIVHGGNDNPNTRYYPLVTEMTNKGAILNTKLMPGVGHTIDFPNRNTILGTAFAWIDSVNCFQIDSTTVYQDSVQAYNDSIAALDVLLYPIPLDNDLDIYPNPASRDDYIRILLQGGATVEQTIRIIGVKGVVAYSSKVYPNKDGTVLIQLKHLDSGNYIVEIQNELRLSRSRLIIQ